jgi:signal transduction histidine kinase
VTRRLLVSYLGLTVLILVILEVPLATLAQRFERDLATTQVNREVNGLVAVLSNDLDEGQSSHLQAVVTDYESRTGGELTVVSPTMRTIAASSNDADDDATADWLSLTRRALQGQTATAFTSDENRPFAVVAAPITADGHLLAAVVLGTPASFTEHRIHEIWLALAAFAVAALLIASAVGVMLARSLTLPIAHLQSTVDRLGRGDFGSRAVEDAGPPEIRVLARRFNQMADRIDELVTAQTRFVADASHQLRSPLTALRLRIENLEAVADEHTIDAISAVGRELQRLSRVVDGLLALSRADQEQPQREEVSVSAVVAERGEAWVALAVERRVDLLVDDRTAGTVALVIPGDLDQILDNLLANALEASSPNGHIVVLLAASGVGRAAIHVIDDGPGLDAEGRKRAFDRFWQGPGHTSGHSGLGLAIVRQLAKRNGIEVELRDSQPHGLDAVAELQLTK